MGDLKSDDAIKLKHTNWVQWKITIESILNADATLSVVTGEASESGVSVPRDAKAKAFARLVRNISENVLTELPFEDFGKDPKKLWDYLVARFEKVNPTTKLEAIIQWTNLKMESGKAQEYFDKYSTAIRKLKMTKCNIDEDVIRLHFLAGLPKEFASIRQTIANTTTDLESAKQAILIEEKTLLKDKHQEDRTQKALYTDRPKDVECFKCREKGHFARQCNASEPKCTNCGGSRHTARQCTVPPARDRGARDSKGNKWRDPKNRAAFASKDDYDYYADCKSDDEINGHSIDYRSFFVGGNDKAIYLDSGSTDHYFFDESQFERIVTMNDVVGCANSSSSRITGRGDIIIKCRVAGRASQLKLTDAKWVPKLSCNLISVSRLCDDGYKALYVGAKAYVMKGNETVLVGTNKDGLYEVINHNNTKHRPRNMANQVTAQTWHARFGHPGKTRTELLKKSYPNLNLNFMPECDVCLRGKMRQRNYPRSDSRASEPLELVHSDVCCVKPPGLNRELYFIVFVDDFSKYVRLFPLKKKSDAATSFDAYVRDSEAITGKKLRTIRTDCGAEYLGGEFRQYLINNQIMHQKSVPYCHAQNGIAERTIQKIVQDARCSLIQSRAPHRFWSEAVKSAAFTENTVPHTSTKEVPYKLFHGKEARVDELKPFGAVAYAWVPHELRNKLQPTAKKMVFMGYPLDFRAYRLFDPNTGRMIESCNVKVLEDRFYWHEPHETNYADHKEVEEEFEIVFHTENELQEEAENGGANEVARSNSNHVPLPRVELPAEENVDTTNDDAAHPIVEEAVPIETADVEVQYQPSDIEGENALQQVQPQTPVLRRSGRSNAGVPPVRYHNEYEMPLRYRANVLKRHVTIPKTFAEAMNSTESEYWWEAMVEEWYSFNDHEIGVIVPREQADTVVGGRWVFELKQDTDHNKDVFKGRYVGKGYSQVEGIDYHETYSPVVNFATIRIALTIAADRKYVIRQFDVKTAFLNAPLDEEIYMEMPEGFRQPGKVLKLKKGVYGLKQSARCWFLHVTGILEKHGFESSKNDSCLFTHPDRELYVLLYVDDLLAMAKHREDIDIIKRILSAEVTLKEIEKVNRFCGIEIEQKKGKIYMSQNSIIDELCHQYGVTNCKDASKTPLQEFKDFSEGKVDQNLPARNLIGSLQYVACRTRPDIAASLNYLSRFMQKPTVALWNATKNLLKYVKATKDVKLCLGPNGNRELHVYTDASHGPPPDRKSITGVVIKLYGSSISWLSKKQKTDVALSSAEAEFYAMSKGVSEGLWTARVVAEFGVTNTKFTLLCDNQSAISMFNNRPSHDAKHIDIRYHFVKDNLLKGLVDVKYIPSKDQIADHLTKALKPAAAKLALEHLVGIKGECCE